MKKHIIDCFDSNIQKVISGLNNKLEQLSPDNFQSISSAVLNLNNKLERANVRYAGGIINSVDSGKLDRMLIKAKANKMVFAARAVLTIPTEEGTYYPLKDFTASAINDNKLIDFVVRDIPAGFTGLQCFVMTCPAQTNTTRSGDSTDARFQYFKNENNIRFYIKNVIVSEIYILFWR